MPDIDTDFDDAGRQKVIDYVVQKYGRNQVAQIVTYGTMAAKMSIKDVARVMDLPLVDANALAKLVPDRPGIVLKRVLHAPLTGEGSLVEKEALIPDDLELVRKIRQIYNGTDLHAKVLHEAERLEGSVRNTGLHAAGIIIAPDDLMNIIPVCTSKESELLVTQIEGSIIEEAGVIKMDFLGLKTLTILRDALQLIRENHGIDIDLDTIPLDDPDTYALYQRADTIGTFQFESPGMQKYLRELKPDRFDDLIAMNALYRPGPLEYIPNFIARKHGTEAIVYDLPQMEEFLRETYGITVYQEQVMLLSQHLAGFTKGDADVLRKAMGKKQKSVLDKMKSQFIKGATERGHPAAALEKIWTDWEAFAQYAFNKSHSTCYAFVAYQTAFLKAHYPSEYMASVLNNAGSIEKITFFMEECKRMGLKVLGPDINESKAGFAVNARGEIRFGLSGLKGVGEAAIDSLLAERLANGPYLDLWDMIKRINQRAVNKKSLECLVKSGAFDAFKLHRAQYFHVAPGETTNGLEKIIRFGNQFQTNLATQSNTLFGSLSMPAVLVPKVADCEPWTLTTLLDNEKDVTGIFLSGHPLDNFRFEIQHYGITPLAEYNEFKEGIALQPNPFRPFRLAGLVSEAQHRISKTGKQFGIFGVEDYSGKIEVPLFGEDYIKYKDHFAPGTVIYVTGNFKNRFNRDDDYEFKVTQVLLLETIKKTLTKQLLLEIPPILLTEEIVSFLERQVAHYPGKTAFRIQLKDDRTQRKLNFQRIGQGLEMNDEMTHFLQINPDLDVSILT
jgi:DNA polymerase-3 subunit alpha